MSPNVHFLFRSQIQLLLFLLESPLRICLLRYYHGDGRGWDGMGLGGRDGMGWEGLDLMGGMGWDGVGWDGMGWDGVGCDGMGEDVM